MTHELGEGETRDESGVQGQGLWGHWVWKRDEVSGAREMQLRAQEGVRREGPSLKLLMLPQCLLPVLASTWIQKSQHTSTWMVLSSDTVYSSMTVPGEDLAVAIQSPVLPSPTRQWYHMQTFSL